MQRFILAVLILLLPSLALAEGVLTEAANPPNSKLYPYQSTLELQDDFLSGATGSGSTGTLGWAVASGTTTNPASIANRPGLVRRDTSATISTLAILSLSQTAFGFDASLPHTLTFIDRLNTNDADTLIRIGTANLTSANPPVDGIYFEKLAADTNVFCVTRAASVETRTDSGVAVNTSFNTYTSARVGASVLFYLNGALVCTHTTNLTAVLSNPFIHIFNSVAAAKTHDVDYFQLKVSGYTR